MNATVMISSVTKDEVPLGDIGALKDVWYRATGLPDRLKAQGLSAEPRTAVPFSAIRKELREHLAGKYGFDVYIFEETPGPGGNPKDVTVRKARKSHLVIGIFGTKTGWKVPDQDPLKPTFREWRAALQSPLTFKVFILKGSLTARKLRGRLGQLMQEVTDYKKGEVYAEFATAADLFRRIDEAVRDHLNRAVARYATDTAAKEPTTESERWLLRPYRARVRDMTSALEKVAESLEIRKGVLKLGGREQPVALHCVPDNFSIPESKKFAAYIFDDEVQDHRQGEPGKLHIVAALGGVTDVQIRRHLGNFEAAEVYSAGWGFYADEPESGTQCVYLPRCTNSGVMDDKLNSAFSWLTDRAEQIADLAERRRQILDVVGGHGEPAKQRAAAAGLS